MLYAVNVFVKAAKEGDWFGATGRTLVVEAQNAEAAKDLAFKKSLGLKGVTAYYPNMSQNSPILVSQVLAGAWFWAYNYLDLEHGIAAATGQLAANPLFNKLLVPAKYRRAHKRLKLRLNKLMNTLWYWQNNERSHRNMVGLYLPGGGAQEKADTIPNYSGEGRPSGAAYCVASYTSSADEFLQKAIVTAEAINTIRQQLGMKQIALPGATQVVLRPAAASL